MARRVPASPRSKASRSTSRIWSLATAGTLPTPCPPTCVERVFERGYTTGVAMIRCGHCGGEHASVAEVRSCALDHPAGEAAGALPFEGSDPSDGWDGDGF